MTTLNKSDHIALGIISKKPISGYGLKQILNKLSRLYWSESNAQIYPTLKKLEKAKLLTSALDQTSGARQKRIYKITKAGTDALKIWAREPCSATAYREELLLKIGCGQYLTKKELINLVTQYRESVLAQIKDRDNVVEHIKTDHKGRADQEYLSIVYEHVGDVFDAKLKWCDKLLKKLTC